MARPDDSIFGAIFESAHERGTRVMAALHRESAMFVPKPPRPYCLECHNDVDGDRNVYSCPNCPPDARCW